MTPPGTTGPGETERSTASLVRTSGGIAVASLVSRITGFVRALLLVAVLGLGVVNDSYTIANTLPNIVYELLLGGVLTSIIIPLLVRAHTEDADGGERYTQRLLTVATAVLVAATALAMLAAPLLAQLYVSSGEGSTQASPELVAAFALLLLPQIVFYGVGALFGAIQNARGVFGPYAWAPVCNNLVVLGVLGAYIVVPGEISLDPVRMGDAKLLVLGLGTTAGIVVQTLVLVPALRRLGFRWRPAWGWDRRLTETGGLALWVVGYVLVGAVGYIVTTRVATGAEAGSVSTYNTAWLLIQVPYGVLGVSLLTALMPRMSRAAALGRPAEVVADLSLGSRLSAVALVPISVLLTVFGPAVGVAFFGYGETSEAQAARLGLTVAVSAFGLLPFAIVMLQLRVFYAMKDSRTPTLIQVIIVAVKVPLLLACPLLLAPQQVVLGLAAANGLSFVVGSVVGQLWLRRRLGRLDAARVLVTVGKAASAAAVGALAGAGLIALLDLRGFATLAAVPRAWLVLLIATVIGGGLTLAGMRVLRLAELEPAWRALLGDRRTRRRNIRRTHPR